MLSPLILLVAAGAVIFFGGGRTLSLIAVAVIVIVWSIGAFVPKRVSPRRPDRDVYRGR
jgi:hypothetical protein